jgi:hypothetical protein
MDIDAHEHPRDSHALLKTEMWDANILPWELPLQKFKIYFPLQFNNLEICPPSCAGQPSKL